MSSSPGVIIFHFGCGSASFAVPRPNQGIGQDTASDSDRSQPFFDNCGIVFYLCYLIRLDFSELITLILIVNIHKS